MCKLVKSQSSYEPPFYPQYDAQIAVRNVYKLRRTMAADQ